MLICREIYFSTHVQHFRTTCQRTSSIFAQSIFHPLNELRTYPQVVKNRCTSYPFCGILLYFYILMSITEVIIHTKVRFDVFFQCTFFTFLVSVNKLPTFTRIFHSKMWKTFFVKCLILKDLWKCQNGSVENFVYKFVSPL